MEQKYNYKILGLISEGKFGKVFVAIERSSGNLVALKELTLKQLSTRSFLRELDLLVTLEHFNLVNYRTLEHRGNNHYIVMDYCEGGTLRNLLEYSPQLTLNQSLKLIIDLLAGLKFAHDQGIVHRNIKPENILLKIGDRNWTAHIANFGIAPGERGNNTSSAYICDLYGVGIILYELVVGKHPGWDMPVSIPPHVPFILRSAISKSLHKIPQQRFQSAAEMRSALQLVQKVLQRNDTPEISIISSEVARDWVTLNPLAETILTDKATHLAIANKQLYLGHGNRFEIQSYQDSSLEGKIVKQWSMTLDKSIRNLTITSQGCMINTLSSIYYLPLDNASEEFNFLVNTLLPVISFPTNNLVCAIDNLGYWLPVSYLPTKSKTPLFEIFKAPNCQFLRSQINRKPWQILIALDRRRGLGIYCNREQNTEFHLFNRRGNWLANFSIKTQLDSVVYNPLFSHQTIATEDNNSQTALLITLDKFKIKRLNIEINPSFIVSSPQGYLLGDRQGKIALINGNSHQINRYQISLPLGAEVTAIAMSATQLLVASATSQHYYLQRFSSVSDLE